MESFEIIVTAPTFVEMEKVTGLPIGVESNAAAQVVRTPVISPECNEKLHKALKEGKFNHLPNMLLKMAQGANDREANKDVLIIPLYEDTRGVLPGQYVAEIHLALYRMPDDKQVEEDIKVVR